MLARFLRRPVAGRRAGCWCGQTAPSRWGNPLTRDVITARAIAAGMLALACLAIVLLGLAWSARWLLDRRRLAAWETAWTSIGPQWSRRR